MRCSNSWRSASTARVSPATAAKRCSKSPRSASSAPAWPARAVEALHEILPQRLKGARRAGQTVEAPLEILAQRVECRGVDLGGVQAPFQRHALFVGLRLPRDDLLDRRLRALGQIEGALQLGLGADRLVLLPAQRGDVGLSLLRQRLGPAHGIDQGGIDRRGRGGDMRLDRFQRVPEAGLRRLQHLLPALQLVEDGAAAPREVDRLLQLALDAVELVELALQRLGLGLAGDHQLHGAHDLGLQPPGLVAQPAEILDRDPFGPDLRDRLLHIGLGLADLVLLRAQLGQ